MKNENGKINFFAVLIIVILVVVGVYFGYKKTSNDKGKIEGTNIVEESSKENETTKKTENDIKEDEQLNKEYYDAFSKIIDEVEKEYPDSELKYDLVYFDDDDNLDLIINNPGYWVSLYIYNDGKEYNPVEMWPYGAAGNAGYEYIEKKEIIKNSNSDFAGAIMTVSYNILNSKFKFDTLISTGVGVDLDDDDEMKTEVDKALEEYGGYYYNDKEIDENEYSSLLKKNAINEESNEFKYLEGTKTKTEIIELLSK